MAAVQSLHPFPSVSDPFRLNRPDMSVSSDYLCQDPVQYFLHHKIPFSLEMTALGRQEKLVHDIGMIIFVSGAFLFGAIVGVEMRIAFAAVPLSESIFTLELCFAGSGVVFIIGVNLVTRERWNDPAYKMEVREKFLLKMIYKGYNKAQKKYKTVCDQHQLVDRETIAKILDTFFYRSVATNALELIKADEKNSYQLLLEHGVFSVEELNNYLSERSRNFP